MGTEAQPGKIACPHCQAQIKAPALAPRSQVSCPKCGQGFRLGEESEQTVQGPRSKVQSQESGFSGQESGSTHSRPPSPRVPLPPPPPPSQVNPFLTPPANSQSAIRNPQSPATTPQSAPPQSAKPDTLVDPNLLPPPPPKKKPKPTEVAVVCYLCGTRTYAPLEKIGQEIKCPDCHSRNLVPPLKADAAQKSKGPTLEGTEDFGMSEVIERPKYRPLVRERSEYDTLSARDPAAMEHRLTVPGDRPRRAKTAVAESQSPENAAREDEEVSLAPPVEVVEAARDPRTVLPKPDLEPEDPMYDGRYDDGLIGDFVDPRSTDAWKRAPFLYGIVEFLFFPSTLLRVVSFSIGLAVVGGLVNAIVASILDGGAPLFLMWVGIPLTAVWLFTFAVVIHAVIVATGNGENQIEAWPDWNVFDWFGPAMYIAVALLISLAPGGLVAAAIFTSNFDDPMMEAFAIGLPPLLSWLILFPFVLHSMLAEDSVVAIISPLVTKTLGSAGEAWVIFYTYSIVIAFLLAGALALIAAKQLLMVPVGACATVAVLLLYARLLGRLMWYTSQKGVPAAARPQAVRG
jgi:hypothetical protein